MPLRPLIISVTTAVVLVLVAAPVVAHSQTILDSDDTSGSLDLVAARQKHRGTPTKLVLKLITYEKWTNLGGMAFVSFEFDKNGDGTLDRCLEIGVDGSLQAQMYRDWFFGCITHSDENKVGDGVLAHRPDEHSVKVTIPKRWLGRNSAKYRWRATTSFEQEGHPDCAPPEPPPPERRYGTCVDFTRWKKHTF